MPFAVRVNVIDAVAYFDIDVVSFFKRAFLQRDFVNYAVVRRVSVNVARLREVVSIRAVCISEIVARAREIFRSKSCMCTVRIFNDVKLAAD